jgi:hypothetical protein
MQQPLAALDGSHSLRSPLEHLARFSTSLPGTAVETEAAGRKEIQRRPGSQKDRPSLGKADMPRYFFNVYHDRPELDEEGEELPDAQAAWHEATVTAGQIIQDLDGRLRPGQDWRLEVTDEFANPLYVIHVSADQLK